MDDLGVPLFSETPVKALDDDFPWKREPGIQAFFFGSPNFMEVWMQKDDVPNLKHWIPCGKLT